MMNSRLKIHHIISCAILLSCFAGQANAFTPPAARDLPGVAVDALKGSIWDPGQWQAEAYKLSSKPEKGGSGKLKVDNCGRVIEEVKKANEAAKKSAIPPNPLEGCITTQSVDWSAFKMPSVYDLTKGLTDRLINAACSAANTVINAPANFINNTAAVWQNQSQAVVNNITNTAVNRGMSIVGTAASPVTDVLNMPGQANAAVNALGNTAGSAATGKATGILNQIVP